MRRTKYLLSVGAVVSAMLLASCSGGSAPESESDSEAPEVVSIEVGDLKIASQTDAYVADKLGYFEEEGLDVNFTYASSGQELLQAVESDSLQIALSIPGSVIAANDQGFDFVGIIADQIESAAPPSSGAMIVKEDSGINSASDLVGKSVAVTSLGAAQDYVSLVKWLEDNGVDPNAVNFQQVPFPEMGGVLEQGQVDAITTVLPFSSILANTEGNKVLSWWRAEALENMPLGAYWAKRDWAEENSDVADRYRRAMVKSIDYLNSNPEEARELVAEFTGLDPDLVSNMPLPAWNYSPDVSAWEGLIEMYDSADLLQQPTSVDRLLTSGALEL